MGLNWQKGGSGGLEGELCTVHLMPPGARSLVAFLTDSEGILSHKVHWIPEERKAFPCLGPDCRLCPWPAQWRWYAPIVRFTIQLPSGSSSWEPAKPPYRYRATTWQRCVLEITKGWSGIVQAAQPDALFHLARPSGGKQTRVRFEHLGSLEEVPPGMAFDPSPVVMRMWGLSEKLWE